MYHVGVQRPRFVADNSVLTNFVDSGRADLLYRVVGPVLGPPSIIDPDPENRVAEFNRYLHGSECDPVRAEYRRAYLKEEGRLWVLAQVTATEEEAVMDYLGRFPRLRRRRGDLEALVLAKSRGLTLLTDDGALRKAAGAEGVALMGSCGILETVVGLGLLPCPEARALYEFFKEKLNLWSKLSLECDPPRCEEVA
ncbi:hypothetical protein TTMY_2577 (plasmid) [Thermus thermophilus]|nr:hypothetical protein TTMY_2577 [Thermus thermophilus]